VASVVGLIVVAGFSQMFGNMAGRLKEMEHQAASVFLSEFIGDQLTAGCENTLRNGQTIGGVDLPDYIKIGNDTEVHFYELRNANDRLVLDLDSEKERMEADYGIVGHTFFQLNCVDDHDSDSTTPPNCDYTSTGPNTCNGVFPCSRKWSLSFISQRRTKGIFQYNRSVTFEVDIEYNTDPNIDIKDFGCNTLTLAGGMGESDPCVYIKGALTLAGCGNTTKNITVTSHANETTAYGHNAGPGDLTGKYNTFIGYLAGEDTTGQDNVFLGHSAGLEHQGSVRNVFLGRSAGRDRISGDHNTIIGAWAASVSKTGSSNVFIGTDSGRTNSGDHNIFVGRSSGDDSKYSLVDNTFIIGNLSNRDWIVGNIGTKTISVAGVEICLEDGTNCPTTASGGLPAHTHAPSSRTVKKNIKPFKNFEKALKDLLKTPLFTYEYKKDHPKKSRMGIISEELPGHLQIKDKDKPSAPDWPSIYGSFWAGIKALNKLFDGLKRELVSKITKLEKTLSQKLKKFKQEIFSKLKNLRTRITGLESQQEKLAEELSQLKTEFSTVQKKLAEANRQLKESNNSLSLENKKLSRELADTRALLDKIRREVETVKGKLKNLEQR